MLDLEKLDFEAEVKETVWLDDPAVDLERTDVKQWFETGEGFALKPQEKATVIKWRALEPDERFEAGAMSDLRRGANGELDPFSTTRYHRNAARFGLVSVEGGRLGRTHHHGVLGLDDRTMSKLSRMVITSPPPALQQCGIKTELRFLDWLGGLISAASFRDGS